MRRLMAALAIAGTVSLAAAGCGDDETPASATQETGPRTGGESGPGTGTSGPKTSRPPAPEGRTIEVTVEGGSVTPNGERVEIDRGEPVELVVTADAPGEIHVHSTPEQELSYPAGTSTLRLTGLERPGVVDVESHTLEQIIVQLEVR